MPFTVYIIEIIVSYKIEKIQISNGVKITIRSTLNSYYKNVCKHHSLRNAMASETLNQEYGFRVKSGSKSTNQRALVRPV